MTRPKKDTQILAGMCARLVAVIDQLELSDSKLSKHLGYSNQTTLAKARRGETFPDVERLSRLAALKVRGAHANLHWIITGRGSPFLPGVDGADDPATTTALNVLAVARTKAKSAPTQVAPPRP
ncbi:MULTISPECIES: hypothetical protein [Variovorax]|uniref:hypothetical protein n=1 Tax=Variovorax TaxID=34072 RepID=UPI001F26C0F1|nr:MULTISPECIES: hypothetical protein [Variovorax]UKI08824.1 hypothetical protein L3V85_02910 [Variovorax paradoxus]